MENFLVHQRILDALSEIRRLKGRVREQIATRLTDGRIHGAVQRRAGGIVHGSVEELGRSVETVREDSTLPSDRVSVARDAASSACRALDGLSKVGLPRSNALGRPCAVLAGRKRARPMSRPSPLPQGPRLRGGGGPLQRVVGGSMLSDAEGSSVGMWCEEEEEDVGVFVRGAVGSVGPVATVRSEEASVGWWGPGSRLGRRWGASKKEEEEEGRGGGEWTEEDDGRLRSAVESVGPHSVRGWKTVASRVGRRGGGKVEAVTGAECRHRWTQLLSGGREEFRIQDDQRVAAAVRIVGTAWGQVARVARLSSSLAQRKPAALVDRWTRGSADPRVDQRAGPWTLEETVDLVEAMKTGSTTIAGRTGKDSGARARWIRTILPHHFFQQLPQNTEEEEEDLGFGIVRCFCGSGRETAVVVRCREGGWNAEGGGGSSPRFVVRAAGHFSGIPSVCVAAAVFYRGNRSSPEYEVGMVEDVGGAAVSLEDFLRSAKGCQEKERHRRGVEEEEEEEEEDVGRGGGRRRRKRRQSIKARAAESLHSILDESAVHESEVIRNLWPYADESMVQLLRDIAAPECLGEALLYRLGAPPLMDGEEAGKDRTTALDPRVGRFADCRRLLSENFKVESSKKSYLQQLAQGLESRVPGGDMAVPQDSNEREGNVLGLGTASKWYLSGAYRRDIRSLSTANLPSTATLLSAASKVLQAVPVPKDVDPDPLYEKRHFRNRPLLVGKLDESNQTISGEWGFPTKPIPPNPFQLHLSAPLLPTSTTPISCTGSFTLATDSDQPRTISDHSVTLHPDPSSSISKNAARPWYVWDSASSDIVRREARDSELIHLTGSGHNEFGPFSLSGTFDPISRSVALFKDYTPPPPPPDHNLPTFTSILRAYGAAKAHTLLNLPPNPNPIPILPAATEELDRPLKKQ